MLDVQAQAYVLRIIKLLMSTSCIGGPMYHVHGHMDDLLQYNQLSVEQIVYCHMDKLALEALMNGVSSERFITR